MTDLQDAWADLLRRRATLRESLVIYGDVLDLWARWTPPRALSLSHDPPAWRASWERGIPLAERAAAALRADDVEELVGGAMEILARAEPSVAGGLQRLAEAWDRGDVGPAALLPARGRIGSGAAQQASGLSADVVAFLAGASLRPALAALFAPARAHLEAGAWSLGVCPFCGGPAAWADVVEDGRRRLACHLCDGAWLFPKLQCPFCGVDGAQHQVRLTPEEASEEGYLVLACRECRVYMKEVDRRTRWNAGPPLIEDWGSPHFDLIAHRQGYWRPIPSLVQLAGRA
jgi:formate dehydrogenase formation protein